MTIRGYCDAAYALILGEYQRRGMSLEDSLKKLGRWAREHGRDDTKQTARTVAAQNTRSLQALQARMAGLA